MDWQWNRIIRPLFGTLNENGFRQYRTAYTEVPRKNGKSELAAAIGLYLLFADNELGCEVFSAAADKEQASIVFHQAAQMVRQSAVLRRHCKIIDSQKRIVVYETGSFYRVLSADAFRQHGLNAHGVIFDELHAQQKRDLWDVLTTSGGTRRQPLVFAITTAGVYDPNSVCMEQHDYAEQILAGTIDDPTFLPVIYSAPEEADWKSPDVWKACNPALRIPENPGGFRNLDEIEALCKKAVIVPAEENKFRRLYLNQWTRQIERWLPLDEWDGCKEKFDFKALERKYCFAGLDLASTSDMTAFVLLFPPQPGVDKYIIVPFFFIPEKTILEKQKVAKAPYDLWNRAGLLKTTPGKSTNYEFIEELIYSCAKKFKIKEIGYDPWQALDMVGRLEREGFEMIEVRQGKAGMNNATKELERLVLNRGIIHSGHKVLRWMINNVAVKVDPAGNISPDKENSKSKIDGVTATVMALDCATRCNKLHSIYDDGRGVIVG
jgi:phage terminase large subunit-like protein